MHPKKINQFIVRIFILLFLLLFAGNIQAHVPTDSIVRGIECTDQHVISSDSIVARFLRDAGITDTNDNSIVLLPSGTEKFHDLFAAVQKAEHHVHMEYFNFRNDSIALALFDLLAVKAQEGVEVRLMFDAFGNSSNNQPLKKKHLKAIRSTGIEIVKFDPIRFPYLNHVMHRDHRKIVVIDGKIGYTGGMNVADYYINGLEGIGEWRDMHMRIEGSAVNELQKIFVDMWYKTTKQRIEGEAYFPTHETCEDEAHSKQVFIVDRWPRKSPKLLRKAIVKSIESAQEKVQLVNPYFVPTKSVNRAIKRALKKGVEVEIMISSKSDIGFTPDAAFHKAHKLMKKGAEVYLYNEGFHHSKIMMIDDRFCTVGSTNLNSRSLRYDYETNAFIFNRSTTKELIDMYEDDKTASTVLTEEVWKQRSRWKRFVGWFANLFTPVL